MFRLDGLKIKYTAVMEYCHQWATGSAFAILLLFLPNWAHSACFDPLLSRLQSFTHGVDQPLRQFREASLQSARIVDGELQDYVSHRELQALRHLNCSELQPRYRQLILQLREPLVADRGRTSVGLQLSYVMFRIMACKVERVITVHQAALRHPGDLTAFTLTAHLNEFNALRYALTSPVSSGRAWDHFSEYSGRLQPVLSQVVSLLVTI